jgi:cyclopropane fatty-acyl-phospholipid synthase-like methyltransferase
MREHGQKAKTQRANEAPARLWDSFYKSNKIPWRSKGLSQTTIRLLRAYAPGPRLLEVGCGTGDDVYALIQMGFEYTGLDFSQEAIKLARSKLADQPYCLKHSNFFRWQPTTLFDVVYDKGMFHGLAGERRRSFFVRRAALALKKGGIWLTICGSADQRDGKFPRGAIYLRDLISPAERYFEVLQVIKAPYGIVNDAVEFDAWHAVFRRRN